MEADDRLSEALAGRYRVERELGEGGMAMVYLAEDVKHERPVALKVLKPALSAVVGGERFLSEIKTTANLQHPHILPVYDSGEADGLLFYVMPYVEGVSLRERLDREQQLPVDEAVRIATAVSHALDYAHRHGVIHRDVKPANILLQDGEPLVADFGIALAVQEASGRRLTETGLSLGTPHYMSPEQATADRDADPRSDTYSLACVVYEMLTGDPPFTGRSSQAVVAKILTDEPRPPAELRPTVPPNVEAAVLRALRKIPADRFDTAVAFGAALNDPSFSLSSPTGPAAAPARHLWNPLSMATTAIAIALLAFTVWSALRPDATAVRRYSLALPAAQALEPSENRPRLALSPDGSRLVYVGPGPQGIPRLWLRERDELEASPLPGTEGAAVPFFSPDGSRIGFLRHPLAGEQQALAHASPTGGAPVILTSTQVGLDGAAWGADGFIYYDGITGAGTRGLMRIAASGGTPEQVTVVDTARGETDHVWPAALPDGDGLLFTILRGGELERADIAALDLNSGERRVLVRGVRAAYAAPDHLVVVQADGRLQVVPFDADRLATRGEPVDLGADLGVRINGAVDLALSPSGTLLYVSGEQATEPRQLTWIDRDGRMEPAAPGWFDDFRTVALSPDGSRVAVSIATGGWGGSQHIDIRELPDGPISRLTLANDAQNVDPVWTPDGRAVTFLSDRAGESDVYRRPVDGRGPPERIIDGAAAITDVFQTVDGEWLVYVENGDLLATRDDADSDPITLVTTPAREAEPAVSPDGRWLAYTSDESGTVQVYVSPFPNVGDSRQAITTAGGFSPSWAHDGAELFHKTASGQLVALALASGNDFRVEAREVLFTPANPFGWRGTRYGVSPDDRRFLLIQDRGNLPTSELIVVDGFDRVLEEVTGG